jgi:hypothetical protein
MHFESFMLLFSLAVRIPTIGASFARASRDRDGLNAEISKIFSQTLESVAKAANGIEGPQNDNFVS